MQNIVIRAIEKQDFRMKEAYKTLRTNLEFSGKKREGDLADQLYAQ